MKESKAPVIELAKIIANRQIASEHFQMTLRSPRIAAFAQPGQFVHVRCQTDSYDPLLRRPISFSGIRKNRGEFEMIYRTVGRGTAILSRAQKGETIDLLGPLGNPFTEDIERPVAILVGGGCGVGPLLALPKILKGKKVHALIGAKTKKLLFGAADFRSQGVETTLATEDGSYGKKGLVTELLQTKLSAISYQLSAIYACGPREMLKAMVKIALQKNIPCQVSLEERMACGLGACHGCVTKTTRGYRTVCKGGPVFDAKEIIWED